MSNQGRSCIGSAQKSILSFEHRLRFEWAISTAVLFFVCALCQQSHGQTDPPNESGSVITWGMCSFSSCQAPSPNTEIVALSAGAGQILALTSDGKITASCPPPSTVRCQIPEPNTDFVAIAAGWYHGLGLKSDGSVVAWGQNNYGQCDIPAPNASFTAVAANKYQSLGLRADGSVVAWGCGDEMAELCVAPSPNSGFIRISAGLYHNLGLKSDGSVVAWGCVASEQSGQCAIPQPNSDFIAVSAGYLHSLGLKSDGTVVQWGYCDPSILLDGVCQGPEPNAGFVAIAAGGMHSLALREDGSVEAWGRNDNGQCDVPGPNRGHRLVAAGGHNSLALDPDCNNNARPDGLDVTNGLSVDCNANWVPDECEYTPIAVAPDAPLTNRYLSIIPGNDGRSTAIRVRLKSLLHPEAGPDSIFSKFEGEVRWVGEPAVYIDTQDPLTTFTAAPLQCSPNFRDWSGTGVVRLFGSEIVPSSTYEIQVLPEGCSPLSEESYTRAMETATSRWGDVALPYGQSNGSVQPDMLDIAMLVNKFSEVDGAMAKYSAQLQPRVLDPASLVSFQDITACVDAFRGYPFPQQFGPVSCP